MNASERKRKIIDLLTEDRDIPVSKISELLDVSVVTIRTDLNVLAEEGLIVRTHGGALPAFHRNIIDRQRSMVKEKELIAKAAAGLIENGEKIMLSAGTTTSLLPKYLLGKQEVHIVTNSTLILPYVRINPGLHVTFVGGEFSASAEGILGAMALQELSQFHVKKALIGTDGFSVEKGVTAHLAELAEIVRKMSGQAEETVLMADSTKFGKTGFAHILPLEKIDVIVTDSGLSQEGAAVLKKMGLKLVIA